MEDFWSLANEMMGTALSEDRGLLPQSRLASPPQVTPPGVLGVNWPDPGRQRKTKAHDGKAQYFAKGKK